MTAGLPRIWIVTNPDHPTGPIEPVRRALRDCPPGVVGIQLRAKRASDRELVDWGRELRDITTAAGCTLSINRRPDVAQIVAADGVHLPEHGLPADDVLQHWPGLRWVGVSRHDGAGLRSASASGATYGFLSPVFAVPEKGAPLGLTVFRDAIAGVAIPTYALGGVTPRDVSALLRAGASGIAVRRAIYDADSPDQALAELLVALDKGKPTGE